MDFDPRELPRVEKGVEFKPPPPARARKSRTRNKVLRRTCSSEFENSRGEIVRCVHPPGHAEFHEAANLNDGWWTDKQQRKGTGS